jgi:PAP2 superfamily
MLTIELSWQAAAVTSACLLGVTAAVRLRGQRAQREAGGRPAAGPPQRGGPARRGGLAARISLAGLTAVGQEAGIVVGLFALWQFAGRYTARVRGGALARAEWIWHAERVARLPSETAVQRLFLPHPLLVQLSNLYYASLHFVVLIALLAWVFLRHRDRYPEVRALLVMLTAACLFIQLIPVAPPRMLPSDGMIDTGVLYGQSVYGSIAGFNPDELSAMPSVHVAWALLIGITVVRCARSRWRWLALAYPAATTLVVVVTANHFWADGIVAGALLLLAMFAYQAHRVSWRALRRRHALRAPPAAEDIPALTARREPAGQ